MTEAILLPALIFLCALLYSSVGHAGASGYLAAMALCGLAPGVMRPAALVLNIFVAAIATFRFHGAGCFVPRLFILFAITSVPCALIGGFLTLPHPLYRPLVGLVLLCAAIRLFFGAGSTAPAGIRSVRIAVGLAAGAAIGLLSGLTGVGGGIFLSPLILFMGWADPRHTAGVSAAFILVNSIAGLIGSAREIAALPTSIMLWTVAAIAGGAIGSHLGSRRLAGPTLRRLLGCVLLVAAVKMFLSGAR